MESLTIMRFWAAAAWADGVLHPAEAAALRRLIEASDDLDEDARREALSLLQQPPAIEADEVRKLRPAWREGVYRAALGIVRLDRVVSAPETAWLERLRASLDLDPATLERIEAEHTST